MRSHFDVVPGDLQRLVRPDFHVGAITKGLQEGEAIFGHDGFGGEQNP